MKYPQLADQDWLLQKYVVEKQSAHAIAKLIGAKSCNSVRQALLKLGVELRSFREAQTANREETSFIYDEQVLEGSLLGDGTLTKWKKSSRSFAYFALVCKYKEYVEHLGRLLFPSNYSERVTEVPTRCRGKELTYYRVGTKTEEQLESLYRIWYPEHTKRLPSNFVLTSTKLLHWFLQDGSCSLSRKDLRKPLLKITLSSQNFSEDDQNVLREQLKAMGVITRFGKIPDGVGLRILILEQESIERFYQIIDECPVSCFKYKWKTRE